MIKQFSSYPDWKAPGEDAALIIWPAADQLLRDTLENHKRFGTEESVKIQGVSLAELRRAQRAFLKLDRDQPVLATGHQTELIHPGVWAKLALIGAAAQKINASAMFLNVDTDAPKHLNLRWPGFNKPISDDPRLSSAEWCGLLDGPSPAHLKEMQSALEAASENWSFKPMALEYLDDLLKQSLSSPTLSATLTEAGHKLDWRLGLRHESILASPIWQSESYLIFAHHLLANACAFASTYNQALKDYRAANGITNPGRPMPDLHQDAEGCEIPFWIDDVVAGTRGRAKVENRGSETRLKIAGDSFLLDPMAGPEAGAELLKFLRSHNTRLSPRALTLTMFARMFIFDQFVHGIGGGRYDQVNDRVIHTFFGIEPPAFSVTTATLFFPTAVGRSRTCLPCLQMDGHRLRHGVLGVEKMEMVALIRKLPRKSMQRARIFSEMQGKLATALVTSPRMRQWKEEFAEATKDSIEEEGIFDRELFFGLQSRDRLEGLIGQYQEFFKQSI